MGLQSSGNFPGGQTAQDNLLQSVGLSLAFGGGQGFGNIPQGGLNGIAPIDQSLSAALGRPFIEPASLPLTGQPASQAFENAAPQASFLPEGLTPLPDFSQHFGRIRFPTQAEIRRKRF